MYLECRSCRNGARYEEESLRCAGRNLRLGYVHLSACESGGFGKMTIERMGISIWYIFKQGPLCCFARAGNTSLQRPTNMKLEWQ